MPVLRWKAPGFVLLACLLLVAPLRADAQTVLIHAGHLVDPAGERVLSDHQILVRDGEIVEVGREVAAEGASVSTMRSVIMTGVDLTRVTIDQRA